MLSRTIALLALVAATTGCIAAPAGSRSLLVGTQWQFTAIDGAAPVATKAVLAFERDRLGANVGCNGMGGDWRVEGGRLIAGPLISTQMWCEGKMEQERAVSALLSAAPEIRIEGKRMSLRAGGHSADLVRR